MAVSPLPDAKLHQAEFTTFLQYLNSQHPMFNANGRFPVVAIVVVITVSLMFVPP